MYVSGNVTKQLLYHLFCKQTAFLIAVSHICWNSVIAKESIGIHSVSESWSLIKDDIDTYFCSRL